MSKRIISKVNFAVLFTVDHANPNGDPLNDNRPRTDYYGHGLVTDVCIKRKIRNRLQQMGAPIFVQSADKADDGCGSLKERAKDLSKIKNPDELAKMACERWLDVRAFGQLFAIDGFACKSVGILGPVSIYCTKSVDPVDIISTQITKSVCSEPPKGKKADEKKGIDLNDPEAVAGAAGGKSSDTMGMTEVVDFGLYVVRGSISALAGNKNGLTEEDIALIKRALCSLFVEDGSTARSSGSMKIQEVIWWDHGCAGGKYCDADIFESLKITKAPGVTVPRKFDDYIVTIDGLPRINPEIITDINALNVPGEDEPAFQIEA